MSTATRPFRGGIHPAYHKDLAAGAAIRVLPMPARLVVPMSQHLGAPAKLAVKAGDTVTVTVSGAVVRVLPIGPTFHVSASSAATFERFRAQGPVAEP